MPPTCSLWLIKFILNQEEISTFITTSYQCIQLKWMWVRSWNCGCLVTWFCYQLIAKPGNKTATVSWPDPRVLWQNNKLNSKHAELYKMYSHFESYLWLHSMEEDQVHNGATLYVAYTILSISWLLMPWWLKEPGHLQAWYWLNKPE